MNAAPWTMPDTFNDAPAQAAPLVPVGASENDLKRKWAAIVVTMPNRNDPWFLYQAARELFPLPEQEALCQSIAGRFNRNGWINDPIVMAEFRKLALTQPDDALPDKNATARKIMNIAEDDHIDASKRLAALKQYSELMGFMPTKDQPFGGTANTYIDNRRMFVMPANSNLDEWEERAKEVRSKQIEVAANS
jgi:hypothetical protein